MNPFDTPDTVTPSASTPVTPQATPATINIDTMLANLGQQTVSSSPVIQISSIDKPLPSVPVVNNTRHRYIPGWIKKIGSLFATLIVLFVGYWFISVQYPLETAAFSKSIIETFTSIIAIVNKNQNSSFLVSSGSNTIVTINTGSAIDEAIETPLSDAIAQAVSGNDLPSSTEQVWDDALALHTESTDTLSIDSSGITSSEPMANTMDQTMMHAAAGSDTDRRESVREKLLGIKDNLNQKLVDLTLSNNTLHLSLVKVALKNIDLTLILSEQAHDDTTRQEVDTKIEQIDQIFKRLEKL